tara:strand:+ start:820 stop:933 length:114 start_codon:yes stop_codon:yes gene_type:complete
MIFKKFIFFGKILKLIILIKKQGIFKNTKFDRGWFLH